MSLVVVDDGSTDGTSDVVRAVWPTALIVQGTGEWFWARSMSEGSAVARRDNADLLLLLNDDVVLDPSALTTLVKTLSASKHGGAVVGATRSTSGGSRTTYSGYIQTGVRPLQLMQVEPGNEPRAIDTFNGNVVLLSALAFERSGGLDGNFRHGMADIDLGYRLRDQGIKILLAPGHVGTCDRNSVAGTYADGRVPRALRARLTFSPKGVPPSSLVRLYRRHAGRAWIINVALSYARIAWKIIMKRDV